MVVTVKPWERKREREREFGRMIIEESCQVAHEEERGGCPGFVRTKRQPLKQRGGSGGGVLCPVRLDPLPPK